MTLHSVGLTAWKQHLAWDANDLEIDGKKTHGIIDEMELPYGRWTTDMTKCVSLAKGAGIVPRGFLGAEGLTEDDDDTWFDLMDLYNLDPDQVDLELVRKVLAAGIEQSRKIVDFDDMLYMPVITGVAFDKQDVVFLDEAQDVNGIQAEIVSRMLRPAMECSCASHYDHEGSVKWIACGGGRRLAPVPARWNLSPHSRWKECQN